MKTGFKQFMAGFAVATLLLGSVQAFADSEHKTIDVVFNKIKILVNDKKVDKENFVFNGITYVPLRSVAELLNARVDYDAETSEARITLPDAPKEEEPAKAEETETPLIAKIGEGITLNCAVPTNSSKGYRTAELTIANFTKFGITDVSAEYLNQKNSKSVIFKTKAITDKQTKLTSIVGATVETGDLKLKSCTYTISDGTRTKTLKYNADTDTYLELK